MDIAKHASRTEPKLAVSDPSMLANTVQAFDSHWNVPGLLLSAAAQSASSQGEHILFDQSNPLSRAPFAAPGVVSSGIIGISQGSILPSSGLIQIDHAQLNFLLSQKGLAPINSANTANLGGAVTQIKSEKDLAVPTQKTMNRVPKVKIENISKRTVDDVDFRKNCSHLSTHDYTSAMRLNVTDPAVHLSNRTDRDKNLPSKDNLVSSCDTSSYKPLAINTDSESMFRFLPSQQGAAQSYPAIHQLLQRCNIKVTDILEKESLPNSDIHRVYVDSSHSESCHDKLCTGCRRWTVSDSDGLSRNIHQHRDAAISGLESGSHLLRQDSVGFEPHDRNPLALLQEVAEAVDARDSLFPEDADRYGDTLGSFDGAMFPTPALSGLHHKFRRKNRPEPLIIPTPVTHFGFQSRLRSPRIIADQPVAPVPITLAPQPIVSTSTSTFMPYTPPPMLSPLRTGSGLFCSLVQPSPKSAPVGLRLGLIRASKSAIQFFYSFFHMLNVTYLYYEFFTRK